MWIRLVIINTLKHYMHIIATKNCRKEGENPQTKRANLTSCHSHTTNTASATLDRHQNRRVIPLGKANIYAA